MTSAWSSRAARNFSRREYEKMIVSLGADAEIAPLELPSTRVRLAALLP